MNNTIFRMHISASGAIEAAKVIFMNNDNLSQKELEGIFNAVKYKQDYRILRIYKRAEKVSEITKVEQDQ